MFWSTQKATATRFELARAEPNRFRIYLLNPSDTLPIVYTASMAELVKAPDSSSGPLWGRGFESRWTHFFVLLCRGASQKTKSKVPPGLEPGSRGSEPRVLTNYTIEPDVEEDKLPQKGRMSEWLRSWIWNPMGSARASSNLVPVAFLFLYRKDNVAEWLRR